MADKNENPLWAAFENIYRPLIDLSSKLPAPLAYSLAVLVGFLVAFLISIFFGATLPIGVLWVVFGIVFLALLTFIITDWNARKHVPQTHSSIDHIINSSIFYVVVHKAGDQTNVIADADVTLALPEPMVKRTGSNGSVSFTIPNEYIGKEFVLNARKINYKVRAPTQVVLRRQGYEFIPLEFERNELTEHHIETSVDDLTNKAAKVGVEKLVYDSKDEVAPFSSWTLFSSTGYVGKHISITTREMDNVAVFKLSASSSELVGVNKSFRVLNGRVEFEYKVERSHSDGPNIFFYMIPMQETGIGRSGLIEVGTNTQDDPRNAFSSIGQNF